MKKSKLSITLVTGFIAAMALSACNSAVKSDKEAIVTFTKYGDDKTVALVTDDVYEQYGKTSAGISKFYDKILEVLTRYKFKDQNWNEGEKTYKEIENWAKNQVQEQKDKASANAKSNGTKYDTEWESILKSNNVENSAELKEKFIYDEEKRVLDEWYRSNNEKAEELKSEFIGVDAAGNSTEKGVKSAMPYHIRHILVKVDEASDAQEKFYKGTVTEDQAKKINEIIKTLAEGKYTFAEVAKMSDDGSANKGGDVGIMTNAATSGSLGMVNEFQLGLYAYDFLYDAGNASKAARAAIKDGLGFTDEVVNALPAEAVEIPYEAVEKMGQYADVVADKYNNKLANGSTAVYPRNIIWNKYFNLHNVFLIKNRKCSNVKPFGQANANDEFVNLIDNANEAVDQTVYKGFNPDGYLTDEKGNVIIGVRSQYGLHLMVIEKSMFGSNLDKYYSTKIPGDDGYEPYSYVGYIESADKEDYKDRAKEVREKINSFDSTYQYRIFDWLTSDSSITIKYTGAAAEFGPKIAEYIKSQRDANNRKQEEGLARVWKTYTRLLDAQESDRTRAPFQTTNPVSGVANVWYTRLVSEKIADDFMKLKEGNGDETVYKLFTEGGEYYYYA